MSGQAAVMLVEHIQKKLNECQVKKQILPFILMDGAIACRLA